MPKFLTAGRIRYNTKLISTHVFVFEIFLKGKLGNFFYRLKVFIHTKLDLVSKGNFHRKAPKWVQNQLKGPKNH